jgi:hypothetical protein
MHIIIVLFKGSHIVGPLEQGDQLDHQDSPPDFGLSLVDCGWIVRGEPA